MKTARLATVLLVLMCLGFIGYVAYSASVLPERVAVHFDGRGWPNDWMQRNSYLVFYGALGIGLPVFFVAVLYAVRFFPQWTFNLPRRDYWLAPEHRAETFAYFLRHGLWMACLFVGFLWSVHYLVVLANQVTPVKLPSGLGLISGVFVAGILVWVIILLRHFWKPIDPHSQT